MKRRRQALLIALLLAGLLAYSLLWLAVCPQHRITPANVDRIQPGMTRAEVEAIFGVPAGEYEGATMAFGGMPPGARHSGDDVWVSRVAAVDITFDDEGRVRLKSVGIATGPETWKDWLWRRLSF
jgi:SmpA / OmlA family